MLKGKYFESEQKLMIDILFCLNQKEIWIPRYPSILRNKYSNNDIKEGIENLVQERLAKITTGNISIASIKLRGKEFLKQGNIDLKNKINLAGNGNIVIQGAENSTININSPKTKQMKIQNLNITGGQVNFADRIDKIVYNQNTGMSSEEFAKLIGALKGLEPTEQNQVLNIINVDKSATEEDKQSRWTQFKEFMMEKGIAIGDNVAAGIVFEGLKAALLG